jgi:N-acetylmuramoyl-L-alanine amidase
VPEQDLAWHAGISFWRGSTRINDTSIGIELENRGWQKNAGTKSFTPFNPEQINALIPLAKDIIARYHIAPQNVVAHADIAPQRKDDPGPLFPWRQLAEQGIGAWPDAGGWRFISMVGRRIKRLIAHCWIRSRAMAIRSRRR